MTKQRLLAALCTSATLVTGVGIVVYADVLKGAGGRVPAGLPTASAVKATSQSVSGHLKVVSPIKDRSAEFTSGSYFEQGPRGQKLGGATIRTDKFDYQPGETVLITGSGFQAGELVTSTSITSTDGRMELGTSPFTRSPIRTAG